MTHFVFQTVFYYSADAQNSVPHEHTLDMQNTVLHTTYLHM